MKTINLTDDQFNTLFEFVNQKVESIVDASVDYQDSEILEDWEDLFDVHTVLETVDNWSQQPLKCNPIEYSIIIIIMSDPFAPVKINTKKYSRETRIDVDLMEDLAELGWDYSCGRMSRSGMFLYDQIMTRLGILKNGEHWNEDCYEDANGDWQL